MRATSDLQMRSMVNSLLGKEEMLLLGGKRMALNHAAPVIGVIVPWVLFCLMYSCVSFSIHYENPTLCKCLCTLGLIPVLLCGLMAFKAFAGKILYSSGEKNWWAFLFWTSMTAWLCGIILGDLNFRAYGQPYLQYMDLRSYRHVDPATVQGKQMMDAGRVHFVDGTHLEVQQHASFMNLNQYCVAPIENSVMTHMDLWAVGLNCCANGVWSCPSFDSQDETLDGLRVLADDQEPFFKLAVESAKVRHKLQVGHPVFFYWLRDTAAEIEHIREEGYKFYAIGMIVHLGWQCLCVILTLISFKEHRFRMPP